MLFTVNLLIPLETAPSQQEGIVGSISWLLQDASSPLHHHTAPHSGVPPAVGSRHPLRRQARTSWEVAAVNLSSPTCTPRRVVTHHLHLMLAPRGSGQSCVSVQAVNQGLFLASLLSSDTCGSASWAERQCVINVITSLEKISLLLN